MRRRIHSVSAFRLSLTTMLPAMLAACSDPAPPEAEVADIVLSVADTGVVLGFRERPVLTASPQAALGVPLARQVSWHPLNPSLVAVEPLNARGDSVRLRPTGVGTGDVQVRAGEFTRTFRITVMDTVYSVTVTPGTLALIAGDTASFTVDVNAPPGANRDVDWKVTNGAVLQTLPSLGSQRAWVQAIATGMTVVQATAIADPTKYGRSAVSVQTGKLAFVVQPTTTPREVPIDPVVTVEVQDVAGNRSLRATNLITLSAPGSCGANVLGTASTQAHNGVATFPTAALSARCQTARLTAIASPPAGVVNSQPFSVTSRSCGSEVPFTFADTIVATFETGDCVVTRGGKSFFAHAYVMTVPAGPASAGFRTTTTAAGFAPRLESYLWQQDPGIFMADSLATAGALESSYWLPPGLYRFTLTSPWPSGVGPYSRVTTFVYSRLLATAVLPGCVNLTAPGATITSSLTDGACLKDFRSRSGQSTGREFVLYQRAGQTLQAVYRPIETAVDNDAYLEVFDLTNPINPALITHDDNSGGGVNNTDAMVRVDAPLTGRFIMIRAARVGGRGTSLFTLTITG